MKVVRLYLPFSVLVGIGQPFRLIHADVLVIKRIFNFRFQLDRMLVEAIG